MSSLRQIMNNELHQVNGKYTVNYVISIYVCLSGFHYLDPAGAFCIGLVQVTYIYQRLMANSNTY